ncbi:hypothetical protein [Halorubellus litoreus]|uniref:Uncharacterized protein n=1 Tax=Halorubellus litoreus TaxID=755308 RepID=A0ABD5V7Z1_9EURY
MDAKQTVKYVAFHQVLATLAAVVGLGIVGVGAWLGFGDAAQIVLSDAPQNWGDAVAAANPTTFVALAVVGVIVWQVGKTVALVVTIGKVADAVGGGGGGADAEAVKRAVLSDVDDRISSVESDVKRHEQALSDAERASSGAGAGRASGQSASASGESGGRRSRRRGSKSEDASTGDGASSSGGASTDAAGGRESNRKSNRRASRSSESGSTDGGDGSAN